VARFVTFGGDFRRTAGREFAQRWLAASIQGVVRGKRQAEAGNSHMEVGKGVIESPIREPWRQARDS
jgi:hypothetical protein